MRKLTHGSLFSGIGGFDLAAEWMGWDNKFHCEWNEFGQKVLHHYWPNAESFTDITKTDFTKYYGTVDIITGGFPCQPYSSAGKRKGKEDERHLWPQMLRAIREVSPRFVVGENVRGLTNWNGGMVFEEVCAELESYGYQVAPVIIPACAVNAPHRRERIWFVAYAPGIRNNSEQPGGIRSEDAKTDRERTYPLYDGITPKSDQGNVTYTESSGISEQQGSYRERQNRQLSNNGESGNVTDSERSGRLQMGKNIQSEQPNGVQSISDGREWDVANASSRRISRYGGESENGKFQTNESNENNSEKFRRMDWEKFPTQPPICGGNDGFSLELDGITFPKWRNESIKAYGNAIVPQVALTIFKAIEKTLYL
jgi:DNA (cytosine-5)-methyltransferase 1